jgi:hypothetical protein
MHTRSSRRNTFDQEQEEYKQGGAGGINWRRSRRSTYEEEQEEYIGEGAGGKKTRRSRRKILKKEQEEYIHTFRRRRNTVNSRGEWGRVLQLQHYHAMLVEQVSRLCQLHVESQMWISFRSYIFKSIGPAYGFLSSS